MVHSGSADADMHRRIFNLNYRSFGGPVLPYGRVTTWKPDLCNRLPDAMANFVWLPMGDRSEAISREIEQRGVVVRPFPGLGIRVTIGTPSENDRFLAVLAKVAGARR